MDADVRDELLEATRALMAVLSKQSVARRADEAKRFRDQSLRIYATNAHQGLLASGKWRPDEHDDLVTRAWDLGKKMLAEDERRLGDGG